MSFVVPNGLSPDVAALTEPMAVALHAVRRSEIGRARRRDRGGLRAGGAGRDLPSEGARRAHHRGQRLLGRPTGAGRALRRRRRRRPGGRLPLRRGIQPRASIDDAARALRARRWVRWRSCAGCRGGRTSTARRSRWRGAGPKRPIVFECVGVPGMIDGIIGAAPLTSRVVVVGVCMGEDKLRPALANRQGDRPALRIRLHPTGIPRHPAHARRRQAGRVTAGHRHRRTGRRRRGFDALGDPETHAKILIDPHSTSLSALIRRFVHWPIAEFQYPSPAAPTVSHLH